MASVLLDDDLGRVPQQSRSRETHARIVRAGETLFAERGYDGTTVQDITSRARCSVGSFYARFKDKESLFLHIHDLHCAELTQRIAFLCDLFEAERSPLEIVIHQTVRALFGFSGRRRAMTRVFIQRSGSDAAFHHRYALIWKEISDHLRPAILKHRNAIDHPDPERATGFVLQTLHALWANDVLHHRIRDVTGHETGDALVEDATAACLAWLNVS
jgi:AcrR family transcriptional regulator